MVARGDDPQDRSTADADPTVWLQRRPAEGDLAHAATRAGPAWGSRGPELALAAARTRLRRTVLPRVLGRAVRRGWAFAPRDQRDSQWWPQGVSAAERSDLPRDLRHRVLATTWYAKPREDSAPGARVSLLDLERRRYQHVLLVTVRAGDAHVTWAPVPIHAGGLVWVGDWLHFAATGNGLVSARASEILRVPDHLPSVAGHRWLLPVRTRWRGRSAEGSPRLRFSFISHDPSADELVVGEYGRGTQSIRLARFALGQDGQPVADCRGQAHPVALDPRGARGMQGAVRLGDRTALSVSRGPWRAGDLLVGTPGNWTRHPSALPMGPEDLARRDWDQTLWSVTEHPHRRWLVQLGVDRVLGG